MTRRSIFAAPAVALASTPKSSESLAFTVCDNFATDIVGDPDTRPDTWGTQGQYTHVLQVANVPPGYRVRVEQIVGDFVLWPTLKGRAPAITSVGRHMGALAAVHRFPRDERAEAMSGNKGWLDHFAYVQVASSGDAQTRAFDIDLRDVANNLLGESHEIAFKQAVWLNDTGLAAHMELTISNLKLRFVRA